MFWYTCIEVYLLKERTQKNKTEQENLEALETDLHNIEQQLQDHMINPASKGDYIVLLFDVCVHQNSSKI